MRAFTDATGAAMAAEIDAAHDAGDTLGGVIEVIAYGMPVGVGTYVQADRRLDARLAAALMGIQAMKGVEIGDGFRTAHRRGSVAHDEMVPAGSPGQGRRAPSRSPGSPTGPAGSRADDQRRAGPGPGRDETDLHRAAGAAHHRHHHR